MAVCWQDYFLGVYAPQACEQAAGFQILAARHAQQCNLGSFEVCMALPLADSVLVQCLSLGVAGLLAEIGCCTFLSAFCTIVYSVPAQQVEVIERGMSCHIQQPCP